VWCYRPPVRFFTIFCPRFEPTSELSSFSSLVPIGVVGTAWPPRMASARTAFVRKPSATIGIYATEIDCPVVRIRPWDRGALDRAAQLAERKYCRS
jgi:hypothetical protein